MAKIQAEHLGMGHRHVEVNLAGIKAKLQQILGPDIGIGVTDPKSPDEMLLPEERPAMARAVEKRVLEFTAGRVAARQAMSAIDYPPSALPMAM